MAPEQFKHQRVGYAVDLWATGVLLYELICGRRPFCSDNEVSEQQHEPAIDLMQPDVVYALAVFQKKSPSNTLIRFLKGLLDPSARRRLTADEALQHSFITHKPPSGDDSMDDPRMNRAARVRAELTANGQRAPGARSRQANGELIDDEDDDDDDSGDFEPTYCLCETPYNPERFYVACDVCDDWCVDFLFAILLLYNFSSFLSRLLTSNHFTTQKGITLNV